MRKDLNWMWIFAIPLVIVLPAAAPTGGNVLLTLALPFTTAGDILRKLSLSGATGNLAAIGLYVMLCIAPLLLIRRGDSPRLNVLLILASVVMFWVMWLMVNPGQMPAGMRSEVGKAIYAGAIYSVMITWGLMKLMSKTDLSGQAKVYSALRIFLFICAGQFVVAGLGFGLSAYRAGMERVQDTNTALTTAQLMPTLVFLTTDFCFTLVEQFLVAWILILGTRLVDALEEDPYSEQCYKISAVIFDYCRRTIPLVAATSMILNLGQVVFARWLVSVNMELRIPTLSLAVAFGMMALTRLLGEGKAIKEDNDLFI